MPGETFLPGEQKIRPGTYARITSSGLNPPAVIPSGIVAALIRSEWGPLGAVTALEGEGAIEATFGSGGTTEVLRQIFRGGARRVLAIRQGTGGAVATITLVDGAAANVVRLDAKHVGTRGNDFTVSKRTSLTDATKDELLVFESGTLLETIAYTPGADEPLAITEAVDARSQYLDATKLADGDGTVADISNQALAGGTAATINGAAQTAALGLLETESFDIFVVDAEDDATRNLVAAEVNEMWANGQWVRAVVAEDPTVAFATRKTNSAAHNNAGIDYVSNGFKVGDATIQGIDAAGRFAGMVARLPITSSITHVVVEGATEVVGPLSNAEIEQAIQAGQIVFTTNPAGQVQVEYGITTLVTPGPGQDDGWKKIRRVRTRARLMQQIVLDTDRISGKVNNDEPGRALVIMAMQRAINTLTNLGALHGGTVTIDPAQAPEGDSAWFLIQVDDIDSLEKLYETFEFRFSRPQVAA